MILNVMLIEIIISHVLIIMILKMMFTKINNLLIIGIMEHQTAGLDLNQMTFQIWIYLMFLVMLVAQMISGKVMKMFLEQEH